MAEEEKSIYLAALSLAATYANEVVVTAQDGNIKFAFFELSKDSQFNAASPRCAVTMPIMAARNLHETLGIFFEKEKDDPALKDGFSEEKR